MKHLLIGTLSFIISLVVLGQENSCERVTRFGEAEICLTAIDGYKECYLDPVIKYIADNTEIAANMVLGYYLEDSTYSNLEDIDEAGFDNYFKIYGTKEIMNYTASKRDLTGVQESLAGNFISKKLGHHQKKC